jgi:hypothetical protein
VVALGVREVAALTEAVQVVEHDLLDRRGLHPQVREAKRRRLGVQDIVVLFTGRGRERKREGLRCCLDRGRERKKGGQGRYWRDGNGHTRMTPFPSSRLDRQTPRCYIQTIVVASTRFL